MKETVYYPLSSPQLSIWYTERMYPGTSISNVAGTIRIKGEIDYDILGKAVQLLIKYNDGMRLRICLDENGNPQQYVSDYEEKPIEIKDFSKSDDPEKAMFEWNSQESVKPFKLIDSDLYRIILVKLSDSEGGIYSNFHHIISDAWSVSLACNIATKYYEKLIQGDTDELEAVSGYSYISYIESEKQYRESRRFIKDSIFWEQVFDTLPEVTVLKTRKTKLISTGSKRKTFLAPAKFTNKLREYCSENKITPYPLFLSALAMYINRVTDKNDITIGTPLLNRLNQCDRNTVGMFISTVPLRMQVNNSDSFSSLSGQVMELCSSVYRHHRYPYDHILKSVREKYGIIDNLYDVVLSYQNAKFMKCGNWDISTRWHFNGHQTNSLTIHINDRDDEGSLIIDYDYHENLYYDKEINFLHQHLLSLLWHALDNPAKSICKLEMIPESEKRKILNDFNNTEADYPREKTIHQLFEEQVEKTPDNIAVIFGDKQITYRELNEKANSLAGVLRNKGVKPDDIIAVFINRSIEMIVGILAVLKAGGAYLFIDNKLPDDRINYMFKECDIKILLSQQDHFNRICSDVDVIDLSDADIYTGNKDNLPSVNNSRDLAYVIFTSGSTGVPKGTMIEHRSLNNFLHYVNQFVGTVMGKTTISLANASFDIFVFELFSTLINGFKLILTSENERSNPERLFFLIKNNNVCIVHGTPSVINLLLDHNEDIFSSVELLIIGGEEFPNSLLKRLKSRTKSRIFNGYGPSECTVGVCFKELTNSSGINIGKPISNTQIYILDSNMNLVPIGTSGEIYIGGECLARGYINPELTTERFICSPFMKDRIIYKTGDIGKWFPAGEIQFMGRNDKQIKINGYRVELDEIRSSIMRIENISNAVVLTQTAPNGKTVLCAYVVTKNACSTESLRRRMLEMLPEYMVPSFIIYIDEIPLTQNGKIDKNKLPLPNFDIRESKYEEPRNDTERKIKNIWENVLNIKNIGVNDILFEIGGDSLDVITISTLVYKQFNKEIPANDIKEFNTIRKMAQYINNKSERIYYKHDQIQLLKRGELNKNIFFIHAGNGEVDNYINLSQQIDNYTCWGIKTHYVDFIPKNISINDIALKYVDYIKSIQAEGPYYISGWCIGGTIAFEMAEIIEKHGEQVNMLTLINSIAPQPWKDAQEFTPSGELDLIENQFNIKLTKEGQINNMSTRDIWDLLIKTVKDNPAYIEPIKKQIPEDMMTIIPKYHKERFEDIIRYVNGIRSLHAARALYIPNNEVKCDVYFVNALTDKIIKNKNGNYYMWNKYCKNKIKQIDIEGDHYSIFRSPAVEELGQAFNSILSDKR